ncbi:unnamed protein product [Phytomonas sp. EM1]|nr:unnamed protein product [Phytomonas sp. EM1]|eukprot:CCW60568.1 unnamed protein product [Phytomonas sp. isolate EM1]
MPMDGVREVEALPDTPYPLDAAQEDELAALRRVHEQPFVVPVTQQIHKLGDTQIVVCETHNPTIAPAYERALKEIAAIVELSRREHSERRVRGQSQRPGRCSSPSSSSSNRFTPRASLGATATTAAAATTTRDFSTKLVVGEPAFPGAAEVQEGLPSHPYLPRGSPNGNPSSSGRFGSPVTAPQSSARSSGGKAAGPALRLHPGEVGLELSIRLSVNEVRWHVSQTRPLAEWTFMVIQTSDESTVIQTPKGWGGEASWEVNEGAEEAGGERSPSGGGGGLMFINDPSQVEDVIQFISKTFYDTINMETFSDFISGELVFDVQAQKCHSFI